MNRGLRSRAGLTLVEVMLSVMIVSTGLVVLVAAASKALSVAAKGRQYEVVRQLFKQLELVEPLDLEEFDEGVESGNFDRPYTDYTWEREAVLLGKEEDEMYEIRTRISWPVRRGRKSEEVISLLHLPSARRTGTIKKDAFGADF